MSKNAPTQEERQTWFLAHAQVSWRKELGPMIRRAYKKPDVRAELLPKIRRKVAVWVASLDDVMTPAQSEGGE